MADASMRARQFSGMNPSDRMGGLIATLRRGDETTARQFLGSAREALRACAEVCDAEGWRIDTLSTPATIFRDLQGSRNLEAMPGTPLKAAHQQYGLDVPEPDMLGRIGRVDLWEGARRG